MSEKLFVSTLTVIEKEYINNQIYLMTAITEKMVAKRMQNYWRCKE